MTSAGRRTCTGWTAHVLACEGRTSNTNGTVDRAGRLTTVENNKAGTILSKFTRTLDAAANPTRVQTTRGTTDSYDHYDYDDRNRLLDVCYGVSQSASDCTGATGSIAYAYDKVSDRTQEIRSGTVANPGTIDSVYNAADQLQSTTKGAQTTSYGYNTNGDQTSADARTFSYDLADRLTSTTASGTTSSYAYDGDGRRIKSTTSNGGADLRFNWDPQASDGIAQLAHERTATGSLVRRYLNGPLGPVSASDGTANSYYHHDPLGSVTDITDGNGAAQWRYDYEPYGTQRSATNVSGTAAANKLGFDGQYQDTETGLYHLRARQYDPATGRFGSLDPVENPTSAPYDAPYAYANARPTVLTDPLGEYSVPGWAQDAGRSVLNAGGNAAVGVADGATGGGSSALIEAFGGHIDRNSVFFQAGQVGGTGLAISSGAGLAAKLGGRALTRAALMAAGGGATSALLGATGALFNCDPYTIGDAIRNFAVGALAGPVGITALTYGARWARMTFGSAAKAERGLPWGEYRPYAPSRELPRYPGGRPKPESPYPHTQLGTRKRQYPQSREFDGNGRPVRDIDWTDHGSPDWHTDPHQHVYGPDGSRGGPGSVWP
jgi:RHS repeat-associated protein